MFMFTSCLICSFLKIITFSLFITLSCLIIYISYLKWKIVKKKAERKGKEYSIGFFHPYCNAGGGGERVLWCAIRMIQTRYPSINIVVYTGDTDSSPHELISRCKSRFNLDINSNIEFVYLKRRTWVEHYHYKYFTLLGQSIGSIWLGFEALNKYVPDLFIDTMGYAFTFPLFKYIANCSVCCYVHYPTISSDMLQRVHNRISSFNNRNNITRSIVFTQAKILYYQLFAKIYGFVGRFADCVMVNSSWTKEHINEIWKCPSKTFLVYPPCDVEIFKKIPIQTIEKKSKIRIVSIAQFRPEKDHPLQLKSLHELRPRISKEIFENIELIFIGSCRNDEDECRAKDLQNLAKQLGLDKQVTFRINISFEELIEELSNSLIGLHSMWNEHFGIGVVECMAAGLIVIAHNSGGPKMDIIQPSGNQGNGFLATTEADYALQLANIINMTEQMRQKLRHEARASVDQFSESKFKKEFLKAIKPLVKI